VPQSRAIPQSRLIAKEVGDAAVTSAVHITKGHHVFD
jgi:hypothetical protein